MSKRKAISKRVRFEVLKRDSFRCQYCGADSSGCALHIDHITPVALGGSNDAHNLVTSCASCNLGKSSIPLTNIPRGLDQMAVEVSSTPVAKFHKAIEAKTTREYEQSISVINKIFPYGWDVVDRKSCRFIEQAISNLGIDVVRNAAEMSGRRNVANPMAYFKSCIKNVYKEVSA